MFQPNDLRQTPPGGPRSGGVLYVTYPVESPHEKSGFVIKKRARMIRVRFAISDQRSAISDQPHQPPPPSVPP